VLASRFAFDFGIGDVAANMRTILTHNINLMQLPCRIPYNPKWGMIALAILFFGACSVFMALEAMNNNAGLIINGVITLDPNGATLFYWVISALGAGFVLMGLLLTGRRIISHQVLDIGTEELLLPWGFMQRKTATIIYADIDKVTEVDVSGQKFIYVTAKGLRYTITASLFPDKKTYEEVKSFLASQGGN
jgi:hypothetical protein